MPRWISRAAVSIAPEREIAVRVERACNYNPRASPSLNEVHLSLNLAQRRNQLLRQVDFIQHTHVSKTRGLFLHLRGQES